MTAVVKTYKALGLLLSYPSADLQAAAAAAMQIIHNEGVLAARLRRKLRPLADELASGDLLDLQERYVSLFDRGRALSLHLFEHVHGESRDRGQAMADLAQRYASQGLQIRGGELPDYLPLFLEFLSLLPAGEAREMLSRALAIIAALQSRLEKRKSVYAPVLAALAAMSGARAGVDEALVTADDGDNEKAVDEEWEESPVLFTAAPPPSTATIAPVEFVRDAKNGG